MESAPHSSRTPRVITAVCGLILVLTACAFFIGLTPWMSGVAAMAATLYALWGAWFHSRLKLPAFTRTDGWALLPLALDIGLIATLWLHRTDAAIASPWSVLPPWIFPLYALATIALFLVFPALTSAAKRLTFILHTFTAYGVSLLIYALGFGYDPFIHQAAEKHLASHGLIEPRNILYLGQYALVAGLSHLTGIATRVIDLALVPALASIIVPFTLLKRFPGRSGLLVFLLLAPFFTFTIPYHLAVLCLFLLLFIGPWLREQRAWIAVVLLALTALAIHPLAGIPSCALALAYLLPQRIGAPWRAAIAACVAAAGIMSAFALQAILAGGSIAPPSIETVRTALMVLFGSPYAAAPNSWLKALYAALRLFPLVWIAVGLWGYAQKDGWKKIFAQIPVAAATGILVAAFFIAGHIRLPDILPLEQYEFALRLTTLLPLFFLEGVMLAAQHIAPKQHVWTRIFAIFCLGTLAACQWFLSYPQSNSVAFFSARGMGHEEIAAVQTIESDAASRPYAVLAHPLMSMAALQEFGFERTLHTAWGQRYFYPIPTGSEPYGLYLELLNAEDPLIMLPAIFTALSASRLYVAVPHEWDPQDIMHHRLSAASRQTWMIEPRIHIYFFQP